MDWSRDDHTKYVRQRQISYDITCMWDLKYDTNECVYKTETDSLTDIENNVLIPKGKRGDLN